MRASDKAWIGLSAGIIAYEVACDKGETLSEACDRYIDRHPVATIATIGMIGLHLANILPPQVDLIHQIGKLKR